MRMRPRRLPDANERAEGRAYLEKLAQNFAMSKGVGKILDSGVGKLGVKVGNTIRRKKK